MTATLSPQQWESENSIAGITIRIYHVAMTHKNGYAGIEPNKVLFLTSHFPKREN